MFEKPVFEQAIEELVEELGREPTTDETNNRMADIRAKAIDKAYETYRESETRHDTTTRK